MKDLRRLVSLLIVLSLGLGLVGCTSIVQPIVKPYSPEVLEVLSGAPLLGEAYDPAELPNEDIFGVTPEMVAFAQRVVRFQDSYFDKVKALHVALLSSRESGGYGLAYSAYTTEVPKKTFESRRANCLSFTLLYVALARHVGINAHVNEVQIPPTWDLRNKSDMVFLRHVNVKVPMLGRTSNVLRNDDVVIDLEMNRYSAAYNQTEIDDDLTAAQFYSNRAMEYLEEKDVRNSFLYLRKAISLNDRQSYLWSNLGTVYGRQKLYKEAETAYLHGLEVNPADFTLMNNLAYIYQHSGNKAGAAKYMKLAQRYRESNPYYQYTLAVSSFEEKQYDSALQYVKRAIDREKKEVRFYELAANIYEQNGDRDQLEIARKKIKKLKPLTPTVAK